MKYLNFVYRLNGVDADRVCLINMHDFKRRCFLDNGNKLSSPSSSVTVAEAAAAKEKS